MKVVHNSAMLMKYLVQDFLDLMSIIRGELKLKNKFYLVQQACFEIIELFEVQIMSKGLQCQLELSEQTPS